MQKDLPIESIIETMKGRLIDLYAERFRVETDIARCEGLIKAARAYQENESPEISAPSAEEHQFREGTMRYHLLAVLKEFAGNPASIQTLWERLAFKGVRTKIDPLEAVKFALFDMRKAGVPIERTDDNTWRYKKTADV